MRTILAAAYILITAVSPARAAPDIYDAVLIKQFLVCDGDMAVGCAEFAKASFGAALSIFLPAAVNGDARAQNNLGMLYETGAGVKRSETEAARLYLEAAEAGVAIAQYNLAVFTVTKHVIGEVTDPIERNRDMATAYMWLTFASEQGLTLAVDSRTELIEFMTPTALISGKRKVKEKRVK